MHRNVEVYRTGTAVPEVFRNWLQGTSFFKKRRLEGTNLVGSIVSFRPDLGMGYCITNGKFWWLCFLRPISEIDFPFLNSLIKRQLHLLNMV